MSIASAQSGIILLVDDEPHVTHIVTRRLKREGYSTVVARDGSEALELAERHSPILVLSDLQMPRMDGLSLAEKLAQLPGTSRTPIIMISGRGFLLDDQRVRQTNIVEVIEKPFSIESLLGKVRALLPTEGNPAEAA